MNQHSTESLRAFSGDRASALDRGFTLDPTARTHPRAEPLTHPSPPVPATAGVCLITESFCIVIVEGGIKSVRRYEKLMMRRIDWNAQTDGDGAMEYDDDTPLGEEAVNKCTCVWKGTAPKPSFKKFRFETLRTEAAARKYLQEMNLAHLFDAAAACVAVSADFDEDA